MHTATQSRQPYVLIITVVLLWNAIEIVASTLTRVIYVMLVGKWHFWSYVRSVVVSFDKRTHPQKQDHDTSRFSSESIAIRLAFSPVVVCFVGARLFENFSRLFSRICFIFMLGVNTERLRGILFKRWRGRLRQDRRSWIRILQTAA